ncbi:MAG: hypothetical protein KAF27_00060 [Porphyrobacter sp.]|nr:hypothetical protein [Porphyrobacter sp.]
MSGTDLSERTAFVGPWILEGTNRLELLIDPSASAAGSTQPDGRELAEPRAFAALIQLPPGFTQGEPEGDTIAEIYWAPSEADAGAGLPLRQIATFEAQGTPGKRWMQATAPAVPEVAREAAYQWLQALAAALEAGQMDVLVAAGEPGIRDLCEASGQNADQHLAEFAQMLRSRAGGLLIEPFGIEDISVQPVANGRLLHCTRLDGSDILKSSIRSARQFSVETRIGHHGGRWWMF